jgi:hypothetical protein
MYGNVIPCEDRFGNKCGAMNFDGTTGYIEVPNNRIYDNIVNSFSICGWAKLDSNADNWWITIACKGNDALEGANSPHFRFQITKLTVAWATGYVPNWQEEYDKGRWYFWALTYDGQQINVFRDGINIANYSYSVPLTPNQSSLEIGRDVPGKAEYFYGSLDDIRIYNRCLTSNEIEMLYNDKPQVYCAGNSTMPIVNNQCNFPSTIDNIPIQYSIREFHTKVNKVRIFAVDNDGQKNSVYINYNANWQPNQVNLSASRYCIFEFTSSEKCHYIIFKSVAGVAVFNVDVEGEIYNIECNDNSALYGIKIIYEQ